MLGGVLALVAALALAWAMLASALVVTARKEPDQAGLREVVRLVPDVLRLVSRLARDTSVGRGVRVRLWLLLGYLLLPIDLVPDFLPLIGYVDDAVLIVVTLRSVLRMVGPDVIDRHWPGTPQGLDRLHRALVLPARDTAA